MNGSEQLIGQSVYPSKDWFIERCQAVFDRIRTDHPLVHHITNVVVANDNANAMLAVGALPVMAQALEEVEEMVSRAQSLVVNLGTLDRHILDSAVLAGKRANQLGIPVVLDPVGAGATGFRTEGALRLLGEIKVTVIRANAGEMAALLGESFEIRGVESVSAGLDSKTLSQRGSRQYDCVSVVTGQTDYISGGEYTISVHNGHEMMTRVTGTGCLATSLCGASVAVEQDSGLAATAALGFLGVAAEYSAEHSRGPGSFHVALFDWMFTLSGEFWANRLRIEVMNREV